MLVRPSAAMRRRRSFVGLVAILVLCTVAFTFLRPDRIEAAAIRHKRH